jgi:hypothetical protein
MKRDMDLIRAILMKVADYEKSEYPGVIEVPEIPTEKMIYHVAMLNEAGLLRGQAVYDDEDPELDAYYVNNRITWQGQDFFNSVKDNEVWKLTKAGAEKAGSWTFDTIKTLATAILKQRLKALGFDMDGSSAV